MQYLSEINENLQQLRETNKILKKKVTESEKELEKLRKINLDQEKRINGLESLISKSSDKMIEFNDVMIAIKSVKKVEVIDKCDYCDQKFERIVCDLSLQSVKLGFANYTEIANYLKQEIRAKTGIECFTKFPDIVNCAKNITSSEIIEKSDQIDAHLENGIIDIAHDIINTSGLRSSAEIADFMKNEIITKFGKIYGTNWLVTVGFGPYYDLSYSVRISKRKFLDFLINDLRFIIFQTL